MKNLQELVGPLFHGFDENVLDEGSLPEVLNLFSVTITWSKGGHELNVGCVFWVDRRVSTPLIR